MEVDVPTRLPFLARGLTGIAWVWFAFAVFFLSDAACMFLTFFALIGSGLLIGLIWLILTAFWPHMLKPPASFVWLTVPLAGIIASGLALTEVGLMARVTLCHSALADDVEGVRGNGIPPDHPRRVGLFHVNTTTTCDDGVYLFTSQSFLNHHGVAHIPAGSRVAPRMSVRRLYGDWYSFEWRF